ncbi:hypothetical protein GUITHDRAFT_84674 [Guillardia theta CCMP2712]|uniref:methylmalonate-semialdehyde dehydrogenase (CoA acylating) n=1 Tax=Guillardia theta (strain CCMP2712) TaxID=905079 RepID=L1JWK4_GUITC|nr:hypothetical protein GUITHDRAFT_84674 [Guillardia theta CCMP2712]EKX52714.1 hypothetical protein GUITHDRAFT_84674 [Guillardia theta CCMP2712]|eukprot:XP_005839694.1 hypothetical protein GUITHDRAFT_84674 [Guillardia theta CCMP2712]
MDVKVLPLIINGEEVSSVSSDLIDVVDPSTQQVLCRVPCSTREEMELIVHSASEAQKKWREVPVQQRTRVMIKFQTLLVEHKDRIADVIVRENGKTKVDALGDVTRGIEVVEHCLGMPTLMMGEAVEQISRDMDTFTIRQPLGVVGGIAPFNFPAMIPLWMMPIALGTGNAFILKPSEKVPSAGMMIVKLAIEAGFPKGIVSVLHGGKDAADFICNHPAIRAVSFVGSSLVGRAIYDMCTKAGKRVQCNMGAKNHAVVMPDANKEQAINGILGAAFGAAGQRCMAISVCVFVGSASSFLPEFVAKAKEYRVGHGAAEGTDIGPVISQASLKRIEQIIQASVDAGATLDLDGRGVKVEGFDKGNFIGPTIISGVTTSMPCYKEEVFGPVLSVVCVDSLEAAIHFVNANDMGNGVALFTQNGGAARKFQHEIEVGQIGINVPVPVPLPFFCWSSSKGSILGEHHFYGKSSVHFYTQIKTSVCRWEFKDIQSDAGAMHFSGR